MVKIVMHKIMKQFYVEPWTSDWSFGMVFDKKNRHKETILQRGLYFRLRVIYQSCVDSAVAGTVTVLCCH